MKERLVMYRERFVGMYSSHVYSLAQVLLQIPSIMQTLSISYKLLVVTNVSKREKRKDLQLQLRIGSKQ